MKFSIPCLGVVLLCGVAGLAPADAQTIKLKLAPGLWEETTTTLVNGKNIEEVMRKQIEQAMSQMTPEQKAEVQKSLGAASGGKHQTCLSAAEVAKGVDIDSIKKKLQSAAKDCSMNVISANETGAKFDMTCAANGSSTKAVGEYQVKSDKEWNFKFSANGNMPGAASSASAGKMRVTGEVQARWKESNCGSVEPQE